MLLKILSEKHDDKSIMFWAVSTFGLEAWTWQKKKIVVKLLSSVNSSRFHETPG